MPMTLDQLATRIRATVQGPGDRVVTGCAGLEEADEHQVSFLANARYREQLSTTRAGAIVVSTDIAETLPQQTLLIAQDPYFAFRQAVVALHGYREHPEGGISSQAVVHPDATLGRDVTVMPLACIAAGARIGDRTVVYPHCYVGPGAVVGDDCILYPSVTVYDRCRLGNRVILHAGTVIGEDGFGYATHQGAHHKIPHVGIAIVEDDVEMGANCAIDRGTIGVTRIGQGTKFSNLVTIAHGTSLGRHNLVVAQSGVAGSTKVGDYVVMGGQSGIAGHLEVASFTRIAAKSAVFDDIKEKGDYGGVPARPMAQTRRSWLGVLRLPQLMTRLRQLEKKVAELEAKTR